MSDVYRPNIYGVNHTNETITETLQAGGLLLKEGFWLLKVLISYFICNFFTLRVCSKYTLHSLTPPFTLISGLDRKEMDSNPQIRIHQEAYISL